MTPDNNKFNRDIGLELPGCWLSMLHANHPSGYMVKLLNKGQNGNISFVPIVEKLSIFFLAVYDCVKVLNQQLE